MAANLSEKTPQPHVAYVLLFLTLVGALYTAGKDFDQFLYRLCVLAGVLLLSLFYFATFAQLSRNGETFKQRQAAKRAIWKPGVGLVISIAGFVYCGVDYGKRKRVEVDDAMEFHSVEVSTLDRDASGRIRPHRDFDLVQFPNRIDGELTAAKLLMPPQSVRVPHSEGMSAVDFELRGGTAFDKVTLNDVILDVTRIGDAPPTEITPYYAADSRQLIQFHFLVPPMQNETVELAHSVYSDDKGQMKDRKIGPRLTLHPGDECTLRLHIGFKRSGVYEVNARLLTKAWVEEEKSTPLNKRPIRILVVDEEKVTYTKYVEMRNRAGEFVELRKFTMQNYDQMFSQQRPVTITYRDTVTNQAFDVPSNEMFPSNGYFVIDEAGRKSGEADPLKKTMPKRNSAGQ